MSESYRPTERFAETAIPDTATEHDLVVVTEHPSSEGPTEYGMERSDGASSEYRNRYFRCRVCGQERTRRDEFVEPCMGRRSDPVTDGGYSVEDARTRRALTEPMTVRFGVRGPIYSVGTTTGRAYTVDIEERTCTCPDFCTRAPDRGCKHVRRVDLEIRAGNVPAPTGRFVQ